MLVLRFSAHLGAKDTYGEEADPYEGTSVPSESLDHATSWKQIIEKINRWGLIRILFYKDIALILWLAASAYATYYCLPTSNPPVYRYTTCLEAATALSQMS